MGGFNSIFVTFAARVPFTIAADGNTAFNYQRNMLRLAWWGGVVAVAAPIRKQKYNARWIYPSAMKDIR